MEKHKFGDWVPGANLTAKLSAASQPNKTNSFVRAFVYLAFQREETLESCSRSDMLFLVAHCVAIVESQACHEPHKLTDKSIMAIRAIAVSLRFRRYCPTEDPFLVADWPRPAESEEDELPFSQTPEERELADKTVAALRAAIAALWRHYWEDAKELKKIGPSPKSKEQKDRARSIKTRMAETRRRGKSVFRIRQWVKWCGVDNGIIATN
jgi:hypothetical protein